MACFGGGGGGGGGLKGGELIFRQGSVVAELELYFIFFGFKPQSSCGLGAYDNMSVMLVKICNPSPTPTPTKITGNMYYLPLWWDGLQLEWGGRSRTWRRLPPFSVPAWTPVTTWTAGSQSPPPPTVALWITTWHDLVTHDNMDSRISVITSTHCGSWHDLVTHDNMDSRISVTTSTHCGSVDHNMTWPGDSWQHAQQDLSHHFHPLWLTTWHDLVTHDNMDSRISVTTSTHCGSVDHNMTWPGDSWQHGQQDLSHHFHPLWLTTWHDLVTHNNMDSRISVTTSTHCGSVDHNMTWPGDSWQHAQQDLSHQSHPLWITTWHDLVTHDNMDSRISVTNHTHCGSQPDVTWRLVTTWISVTISSHCSTIVCGSQFDTTWHDLVTHDNMISVTTSTHCSSVNHNRPQHEITWWLMTTWISVTISNHCSTIVYESHHDTTWPDLVTYDNMDLCHHLHPLRHCSLQITPWHNATTDAPYMCGLQWSATVKLVYMTAWCTQKVCQDGSNFMWHQPCNNQTALHVHDFTTC